MLFHSLHNVNKANNIWCNIDSLELNHYHSHTISDWKCLVHLLTIQIDKFSSMARGRDGSLEHLISIFIYLLNCFFSESTRSKFDRLIDWQLFFRAHYIYPKENTFPKLMSSSQQLSWQCWLESVCFCNAAKSSLFMKILISS